ncbi:beta-glucosidase [Scheffersomyces xylosifermentans]|uniref:beta-glucosidase n=1 Tax=Scheffersomyces xylosifermentans TaxID=1304137 RepID=UPI00315DF65F
MTTAKFDIDEILSLLTLEEKIGLIAGIDFWHTYGVKRLGIPSLRFSDGPNGLRGTKFFNSVPSACFPCGTGLAATFDKDLLFEAGQLMGVEAKHKGAHVILGPTMNIQRGPLGGRGFESFSEDPHLSGQAAAAIVRGIQDEGIAATVKHFVCNDLEDERNSSNSVVTERALRELYLEPFRLAIKYSNPRALMTAYNKINGDRVSQSHKFLQQILRDEWKWDGTIMSDWYGCYTNNKSIENGLDIEMPGPPTFRRATEVRAMIVTKELHMNHVDDRVRNVLKLVKYALQSGVPENAPEDTDNNTPETRKLLRKLAQDSVVLLKNEDNVLPLKKDEKIVVLGPNAKYAAYCGGGSASLRAYYTTTPYDSIAAKTTKKPEYTVGAYGHRLLPGLAPNLTNPITGKPGYNLKFYREPRGTPNRTLIDEYNLDISYVFLVDYYNHQAMDFVFYVDFDGDFTPEETAEYEFGASVVGTAVIYVDEKLVVDNKTNQRRGNSFFNSGSAEEKGRIQLEKGKTYKVRIEFSSGPTFTVPQGEATVVSGGGGVNLGLAKVIDPEEEIKNAAKLAKEADKVVLNIGLNQEWEAEGFDRTHMELVGLQNKLIEAVLAENPNTVIVNQSGTPVEMPWLPKAKALVQAWYGGNEAGNGIADVLFGDVNPSGKLSLSFPHRNIDNPAYLNFKTERGRVLYSEDIFVGYRFYEKMQREVAFPFGFGLSYTTFDFSDLKVRVDESEDNLEVSVKVTNSGKVDGSEVVQIYIGKKDSDVIRPIKELKGFEKLFLKAGSKETVISNLSLKESVSFFDEYQMQWSVQSGEYQVYVGNSSDNATEVASFDLKKVFFWSGN